MKKGVKTTLIVLGAVVVVLGGLILGVFLKMSSEAKAAFANLTYEQIDMSAAKDGTFEGEAGGEMVFAKVAVTVKDHTIQSVAILEHKNGRGQKAEAIVNDIVAANNYDVDAVSGATLSSETIKSAVSKALKASEGAEQKGR